MTVTYDASRVTLVDHPLVQHKLSILRDKNTGTNQFRQLVRELALFDGYEAMRDLPMEDVEVETPITTATFKQLAGKKLAIVPILRAGLGMVDGILDLVPSARVGHIGMERDAEFLGDLLERAFILGHGYEHVDFARGESVVDDEGLTLLLDGGRGECFFCQLLALALLLGLG